jgi:hypothetical protein
LALSGTSDEAHATTAGLASRLAEIALRISLWIGARAGSALVVAVIACIRYRVLLGADRFVATGAHATLAPAD